MPTYKNNTTRAIRYKERIWVPNDQMSVLYYIPDTIGLTLVDSKPLINMILLSDLVTVNGEKEVDIPVYDNGKYSLDIVVESGECKLFLGDSINGITLKPSMGYQNKYLSWNLVPFIKLTSGVETIVRILIEKSTFPTMM